MSTSLNSFDTRGTWWELLGLRYTGPVSATRHEHGIQREVLKMLREHPPIAFARETEGPALTLEQVTELVRQAAEQAEREGERQREAAERERRQLGWEQIEQALTGPGANDPVSGGRWAGFSRGEATAWCWNLFQYEPHGFVSPGAILRIEALRELQAGGLPEVFAYPERARELADQGLTPREYRRHKEALGAKTFTPADVQHG